MTNRISYLVVSVLFLCTFGMYGQADFQRKVSYETSTNVTFNLSCWVDINSLSDLDLVSLQAKPELIRKAEYVIDHESMLTITHRYPQQPRWENDYEFEMGKSVTDAWGTTLFDHQGVELYHLPYESSHGYFYSGFLMSSEEVSTYGVFNDLFHPNNLDMLWMMAIVGEIDFLYDAYRHGSTLLIIQQKQGEYGETILVETEMDFEQLYVESRVYIDNVHETTERIEYQWASGGIIPKTKQMISYRELPSGIPFRITETATYLSYQVVDENENVVAGFDQALAFEVSPNPADDHIVLHFATSIDDWVHIQIFDLTYGIWWEYYEYVSGYEHFIHVCHYNPGLHHVVCSFGSGIAMFANFVKDDGTGQQPPTKFDIQVFPTIAQDHINVRFSLPIDNMIVEIMILDAMGNVYIHIPVDAYHGGTQQINVSALPQGTYHIIGMNDYDGTTAQTTFFKR